MKMKHWGVVAAAGFGEMLLSSLLLRLGAPRTLAQVLVIGGAAVFFGGILGSIAYSSKHPPLRCPGCGRGIDPRHMRRPDGGIRLTGREAMQCPHCGAMFQPWNLRREEE